MRRWLVVSLACANACFSPDSGTDLDDTDGPTSTSTTATTTSVGTTVSTTDDPSASTTSATGDTESTTSATTDTDTSGATATGGSTGETELGPQLVMSIPADGDLQAPLQPYFFLYFDRVVSVNDAVGKLHVSQDGGDLAPVSPLACPPDNDPMCVAALFPASFADPDSGRLPGSTPHQIVVDPDFPDPDGNVNTMPQTVDFTTFDLTANAFDDSATIDSELGGIAYDPVAENLYLFGSTSSSTCVVRRIPVPAGVFGSATTVATPVTPGNGQDVCYGMSLYGDALFVTLTYDDEVVRYNDLALPELSVDSTVLGPATGLPGDDDDLGEVWSVARAGTRTFFSFGNFHGGVNSHSILEMNSEGVFSVFNDGANLWVPDNDEVVIATGIVAGVPYLFAHDGDEIHKIRLSDGVVIDSLEVEQNYGTQLWVDGDERLYLGEGSGVHVYDATDMSLVTERLGFDASRFAVAVDGDVVTVYFGRYRDPAVIGSVQISF